ANLVSPAPNGFTVAEQPSEPARTRGVHPRRPGQAESRSEVFVVGIHFVANQKLAGIKSGERRIPQGVGELCEVLGAQAERHCERWRGLPIVLEEVGLVELVRMENGGAENPCD